MRPRIYDACLTHRRLFGIHVFNVSRMPQTEHNAPCGYFFSGLNWVKKNLFPLQTGQTNLRLGITPPDCGMEYSH